ncbi:MAG: hypothetical protein NC337_06115 [Roseburia sp.]|nr:hypothetical protein [Roseburia sp.]
MWNKIRLALRDIGLVLRFGAAVISGISLLLFLIGRIGGKAGAVSGLMAVRNGNLLFAAIALFLTAGMLMTKGKRQTVSPAWSGRFKIIRMEIAAACIAGMLLAVGIAADFVCFALLGGSL